METTTSINLTPQPGATPNRQRGVDRQLVGASDSPSAALKQAQIEREKAKIAEVANGVQEERVKSLDTLRSVSNSIEEAVEVLNEALSRKSTSALIRRDEELNRYLVTIRDKDSGEVVREIPDEALLKFARNLQELKGILFDETL